ncbi:MAG: DUF3703 domain-containing protein [Pseudohongiella sp.]|nr:DUF3703 domain-containing protein [Pseudohongiella sp.]
MNSLQRAAFDHEITHARELIARDEFAAGFAHLERAHVIGQANVVLHVKSHWLMLKLEIQRQQPKAVLGQLLRIVLGALGSAVGIFPVGNTGGTNVSMFKRMPIAPELQKIIDGDAQPDARL